jgi:hypothetical protein
MRVLDGLHFSRWAAPPVRAALATLSLLAAFCVLAGNLLWIGRRAGRRSAAVLARLTVAAGPGLSVGVGAIFVANQVLPAETVGRASWEHVTFFTAWGVAAALALLRRDPAGVARAFVWVAAALLVVAVLADAAGEGRVPLDPRGPVFAVELGLGLAAAALAFAGHVTGRLARPEAVPSQARASR